MKKIFIALASLSMLIILLIMCTEQRVSYEYFGRFTVTTNLTIDKLKWEGGNSRLNYVELCRDDGALCFRGDNDLHYSYSRKLNRLAAYSSKEIKIYNTQSGAEILCDFSALKGRLKHAVDIFWSESSLIVFSQDRMKNDERGRADTYIVASYSCQLIKYINNPFKNQTSERFQDEESRNVAWFECGKNSCTLSWLDSDFITFHSKKIGCNESNWLDIAWSNGVPEPRNYEWPKNKMCLNEKSKPKYPFTVQEEHYDHIPDK